MTLRGEMLQKLQELIKRVELGWKLTAREREEVTEIIRVIFPEIFQHAVTVPEISQRLDAAVKYNEDSRRRITSFEGLINGKVLEMSNKCYRLDSKITDSVWTCKNSLDTRIKTLESKVIELKQQNKKLLETKPDFDPSMYVRAADFLTIQKYNHLQF